MTKGAVAEAGPVAEGKLMTFREGFDTVTFDLFNQRIAEKGACCNALVRCAWKC